MEDELKVLWGLPEKYICSQRHRDCAWGPWLGPNGKPCRVERPSDWLFHPSVKQDLGEHCPENMASWPSIQCQESL